MAYYPMLMDLETKRTLVVGGGGVAERKVGSLLEFGAQVDVISRTLSPGLKALFEEGRVQWAGREFEEPMLAGAVLVIAATDDPLVNQRISAACREKGIPVNVVDRPEDCTFIVPAVVRRGDLLLAVSTSGKSPALSKVIREELEERFGPEYGDFLELMGYVRETVLSFGREQRLNQSVFRQLVQSNLLDAVRLKDWGSAAGILTEILGAVWSERDVRERVEAGERGGEQCP